MQAKDALKSARIYLNDINGLTWSDSILLPFLQESFGEMIQRLDVNSIGVIKAQTSPILVPTGSLNLGNNQPTNILEPISMQERDPNTDSESFVDMYKVNFLPSIDQSSYLTWWTWLGEVIQFVGATSPRQVILRYKGSLTTPEILTDPIGVIYGERFLGPRTAELAYDSIGKDSSKISKIAETNMQMLIRRNVLSDQTPVRRRAYRSPKSTLGMTGPVAITVPVSGGNALTWVSTSTPPDGVITNFIFPYLPKFISWNGLNQFQGVGYTLSVINGQYNVVFKDVNGATLTPGIGDDIREAY